MDVRHAIGVSSGTDALLAALMALDIGPGDEVVTSTFSFFATAGSIARVGATPVLVDIEPDTFNIDPSAATRAVHATDASDHAGAPVRPGGRHERRPRAGREYHLRSSRTPRRRSARAITAARSAAWATLGCFSFFPSKNLGGFGDGGLVTTNDDALAHKVRLLRNHGMEPKYFHQMIGGNFRLDALQAAVLRVKLPHLAGWTDGRRANAARYRALFAEAGLTGTVTLPSRARRPASTSTTSSSSACRIATA